MATRFEVTVDALGRGRIIKDGVDISNEVSGFDIHASVGSVTVVTLHCIGDVSAAVETEQ